MSKELTVVLNGEQKALEIREGQALPLHELKPLILSGSLSAPGDFKYIRPDQFPIDKSHVIVNRDNATIILNAYDREDVGRITISGSLETHPDFVRLGINDPEVVRQPGELATWIKMNRTFFQSKSKAMELVSTLRQFKATIAKIMEEKTDDRANYSTMRQQVVESNIPASFEVSVPFFVGEKPQKFDVEIVIDPDDFGCALISPDAADLMKRRKDEALNEQIDRFEGYAIIYK